MLGGAQGGSTEINHESKPMNDRIGQAAREIEKFSEDHKAETGGRSAPRAAIVDAILRSHFPDIPRVLAWFRDPNHKPAHLAFTAGPDRELADELEGIINIGASSTGRQKETQPCCECGEDYDRDDLMRGEIYCPKCREKNVEVAPPTPNRPEGMLASNDPFGRADKPFHRLAFPECKCAECLAWIKGCQLAITNPPATPDSSPGLDLPDAPGVWFRRNASELMAVLCSRTSSGAILWYSQITDDGILKSCCAINNLPRGGWSRAAPESEVRRQLGLAKDACQDERARHEEEWQGVNVSRVRHIENLESQVQELRQENERLKHENHEAHAMLTGKYEIGWCMTHPDNKPDTELGKAAMERNAQLTAAQARITELESSRYPRLIESGPLPDGHLARLANKSQAIYSTIGMPEELTNVWRSAGWQFWDYGPLVEPAPTWHPIALNPCVGGGE